MPQRNYTDMARNLLHQRQGGRCPACGKKLVSAKSGRIHHHDSDPDNNEPSNLVLLHESCHPNPGRPVPAGNGPVETVRPDVCVRVCVEGDPHSLEQRLAEGYADADAPAQMRAGAAAVPKFRAWVLEYLGKQGVAPEEDLINGGAELTGKNVITVTRWLKPMRGPLGPLVRSHENGQWVLRPKQQSRSDGAQA